MIVKLLQKKMCATKYIHNFLVIVTKLEWFCQTTKS